MKLSSNPGTVSVYPQTSFANWDRELQLTLLKWPLFSTVHDQSSYVTLNNSSNSRHLKKRQENQPGMHALLSAAVLQHSLNKALPLVFTLKRTPLIKKCFWTERCITLTTGLFGDLSCASAWPGIVVTLPVFRVHFHICFSLKIFPDCSKAH